MEITSVHLQVQNSRRLSESTVGPDTPSWAEEGSCLNAHAWPGRCWSLSLQISPLREGNKEIAGCFFALQPAAPCYHLSGSNHPRGYKTKASPIGHAATSFHRVRRRSKPFCRIPYPRNQLCDLLGDSSWDQELLTTLSPLLPGDLERGTICHSKGGESHPTDPSC